jgi:hypothetical protein
MDQEAPEIRAFQIRDGKIEKRLIRITGENEPKSASL